MVRFQWYSLLKLHHSFVYALYIIPVNQSKMFRSLPGIIIRDTCASINYIN
jgi:hypothetical protein